MYQSLVFIAVSAVPVLVFLKLLLKLRPLRMRSRLATPTPHMLACGQDGCHEGRSSLPLSLLHLRVMKMDPVEKNKTSKDSSCEGRKPIKEKEDGSL